MSEAGTRGSIKKKQMTTNDLEEDEDARQGYYDDGGSSSEKTTVFHEDGDSLGDSSNPSARVRGCSYILPFHS